MVRPLRLLLPLALLLAGGWALSDDEGGPPEATTAPGLRLAPVAAVPTTESCDLRPRYAPAAVRVEDDVPYAPRDGWERRMDVALPPGPGPHPGVLLFHAGGWANGSEDDLRHRIVQLATHGYAAASVRYRLANRPAARRHPAQVSDARCAARTFAARADIDASQLVAAGFSAGGHLASMLAVAPEVDLDDGSCPLEGPVPTMQGGISYYGVLDLRRDAPVGAYTHRSIDNFLGRGVFGAEPTTRAKASPVVHLDPRDPPLLVAHGDADDVVSVEVGRAFRDAAAQARVRINYLEIEDAGHGFAFLGGSDGLRRVDCTALRFLRARIGGGDSGATAARRVPTDQRGSCAAPPPWTRARLRRAEPRCQARAVAEVIGEGPRVKFTLARVGDLPRTHDALAAALAEAVRAMEDAGCCPVLDDGLSAGNGALRLADGTLLVTPSGRRPGRVEAAAMVQVVAFDSEGWVARYRSRDPATKPTSDAALHWAALVEAPARFGWTRRPGASLHGHVLETTKAAATLGLPLSAEATLFSTPADREALLALFAAHAYPAVSTVVRRDHGFFTLGADAADARGRVETLAARARAAGLLPERENA